MPRTIGKYEILGEVGRGAMAAVYRARDPVLDRVVALKTMFSSTLREADARERFLREARSVARLQHPNVITIFELGEVEGMPFIAMEFLDGLNLADAVARGRVASLRERLEVVVQLCDGLAYAHRRGVIHRDVKPSNAIVGGDGTVKLVDFGIARFEGSTFATSSGELLGTPHYMAPEQFEGKPVDHRVDIWAVGVMLYELVTGRRPYDASTVASLIFRIVSAPPARLDATSHGAPGELAGIVHHALEKDPARRYQDLGVMARDLRRVLAGGRGPGASVVTVVETPVAELVEDAGAAAPETDERARGTGSAGAGPLRPDGFRELADFGERGELQLVEVSPDETLLAVGAVDGSVRLWDLESRMKVRTLRCRLHLRTGHAARVTALAFSADGRLLASGHLDGAIYVWEPGSGLEMEAALRHDGTVGGLAFDPTCRLLASGGADATLKLWEVQAALAGEARRQMRRQPGDVSCLAMSPDGSAVVTGHGNRCLRVHDLDSGRLLATLHGFRSAPAVVRLPLAGDLVATGGRDGVVSLHRLSDRGLVRSWAGHPRSVASLDFFGAGPELATVARDSMLMVWHPDRDDPLTLVEGRSGEAFASLRVLAGRSQMVVGLGDGRLRLWEFARDPVE